MIDTLNTLISLYATALLSNPYPTLAMTIMIIAIGLWIYSYPR